MEKSKTRIKVMIIIMAVVSLIFLMGNLTLALFGDNKITTGIIQFSQHKLEIEIVGDDSVILAPEELTVGSNVTRTLNITNPSNSTGCVFRLWLEFKVEGEASDYLTFSVDDSLFSKNTNEDKYYYDNVLQTGGKAEGVILTFEVKDTIDSEEYQGKKYSIKLYIESMQATKEAVEEWGGDYTSTWYDKVKGSFIK